MIVTLLKQILEFCSKSHSALIFLTFLLKSVDLVPMALDSPENVNWQNFRNLFQMPQRLQNNSGWPRRCIWPVGFKDEFKYGLKCESIRARHLRSRGWGDRLRNQPDGAGRGSSPPWDSCWGSNPWLGTASLLPYPNRNSLSASLYITAESLWPSPRVGHVVLHWLSRPNSPWPSPPVDWEGQLRIGSIPKE